MFVFTKPAFGQRLLSFGSPVLGWCLASPGSMLDAVDSRSGSRSVFKSWQYCTSWIPVSVDLRGGGIKVPALKRAQSSDFGRRGWWCPRSPLECCFDRGCTYLSLGWTASGLPHPLVLHHPKIFVSFSWTGFCPPPPSGATNAPKIWTFGGPLEIMGFWVPPGASPPKIFGLFAWPTKFLGFGVTQRPGTTTT